MRLGEWLLPFRSIATSLARLVELYELELQSTGALPGGPAAAPDGFSYQDDQEMALMEERRRDWMARGGRPLLYDEAPPSLEYTK